MKKWALYQYNLLEIEVKSETDKYVTTTDGDKYKKTSVFSTHAVAKAELTQRINDLCSCMRWELENAEAALKSLTELPANEQFGLNVTIWANEKDLTTGIGAEKRAVQMRMREWQ